MAYFIIAVENCTADQRNEISKYVGKIGGYWHWMSDLWLVNTYGDDSAADMRDAIQAKAGSPICIVLKVNLPPGSVNWAGLFPTDKSKRWADWLNKTWKPGV